MKINRLLMLLPLLLLLGSCYKDYVDDYVYSSVGFAIANPVRTVIADRDMEIRLGVSIGGKRAVDKSDWARFEVDPTLLTGTVFQLLPAEYYTLSNANTFTVQKDNLPVADVGLTFTPAFYADEKAVSNYYALPLRIKDHSLDSIMTGKGSTVAVIRYINTYHGTYYVKGSLYEMDNGNLVNTTVYNDKDLVKNITRDLKTTGQYTLERPGLANFVVTGTEKMKFTVTPGSGESNTVTVETAQGGVVITEGEGQYFPRKTNPEFTVKYAFTKGGKTYKAEDTLVLRQDPLLDLRVETW